MSSARGGGRRKAAFIDRDGVINRDHGYVYRVEEFEFLPGAVDALSRLQAAGYLLVVVSNQSGLARGLFAEADYEVLTAHMRARLLDAGVRLDAVEHCPHLPDAAVEAFRLDCDCRKPRAGMLTRAAAALDVDVAESILIGDRASDIEAGRAAGVGRCFLVRTGKPVGEGDLALADGVYDDLATAAAALSTLGVPR